MFSRSVSSLALFNILAHIQSSSTIKLLIRHMSNNMDDNKNGPDERTTRPNIPANSKAPPKSRLKTLVYARGALSNHDGDTEMVEAVEMPGSIAGEPVVEPRKKQRKRRTGIPDMSEDDEEHEDGNDDGKVVPSKRRKKGKATKPATSVDTDKEEQQHPQALKVPPKFEIAWAALAEKEEKDPKRPDKTIIIARRKRWENANVEVLIWNDCELEWMRKTHATKLYKKTVERFEKVEENDWIDVDVPGWYQVRILDNVVLTDGPEKFITRFSNEDYDRVHQMLIFILSEVLQPRSWLVEPEEGSYQYATHEDEAKAMASISKSAQELVEIIWKPYIDDSKPDGNETDGNQVDENQLNEETYQNLSDVNVIWTSASNKVGTSNDDNETATTTVQTSKIKLTNIWTVFIEDFHVWQRKRTTGPVLLVKIVPPTIAERKELGRRIITDSPHVARPSSWPYLLALALLADDEAEQAEEEVGLIAHDARSRNTIHTCMEEYQEHKKLSYAEAVHTFWLLQQSLQDEQFASESNAKKPDDDAAPRPGSDREQHSDSEHDNSTDTSGDEDDAPANEKSARPLEGRRHGKLANEHDEHVEAEDAEDQSGNAEIEGDGTEADQDLPAPTHSPQHQGASEEREATAKSGPDSGKPGMSAVTDNEEGVADGTCWLGKPGKRVSTAAIGEQPPPKKLKTKKTVALADDEN
ncbi:uncharacterized protein J4E88_005466 [Alternaria novae-zelandiae]|uniref:uncharacterized protein n=1 Tax=Alternaria novae-zelandiae TaxID=430562 RepID=UPI0020C273AE|nr:uncharacterized protein J4E88_005466 [Alternaria novae-zelandiae]KAI4680961.1 hypothetical protein J4E88_005466 [Alternaria novae-zelandiae]